MTKQAILSIVLAVTCITGCKQADCVSFDVNLTSVYDGGVEQGSSFSVPDTQFLLFHFRPEECSACNISLLKKIETEVSGLMKDVSDVNIIFSISPGYLQILLDELFYYDLPYKTYICLDGSFLEKNRRIYKKRVKGVDSCCLLDTYGRVLFKGNPIIPNNQLQITQILKQGVEYGGQ